ncbi:hypothetical protein ACFP56_10630 [Paenibacillus septentrionalis]|uniref:Lipocalin-like domain-containing protein n=1 Tax=Paenibacillus septentrionalis TaxID=429342 RepID=A0ABW1V6Q7_9BACL
MPKIITLLVLLMVPILLSSCMQDNKSMLLGAWEAEQVSQIVGSDDKLGHYNHLEVTENNVHAKTFNLVSIEGGDLQKQYNEKEKNMNYQWRTEKEILIQDSLYEIELKRDKLVLKNKSIEIHYKKI